ncbi:MAG: response regulator [Bacillati bacterium ANGP1]|uniref:Response regulator n=1 Tax=Candidatus Segetimicrobium genomatis TaxID=2569760 RepID=A0A537JN18_9BACT|nr:MAG: response regulator [Terrabacteria group bacterium ANGP1]
MPSQQPPAPSGVPGPRNPEGPGRRPSKRLRVLIVEDEPAHAELEVRELLRAEFAPEWQRVETEEAYLEHLGASPDLILADYSLPQFGAARALDILNDRGLDIPFIVISGTMGEEVAVDLMRRGAADYLLKDRLARLGPAVHRVLDQQRLRRHQQHTEGSPSVSTAPPAAARSWTPTRPTCSSWDTRTWRPCGPRKRDRSTSIPRCGRSGSPCWNGRAWSMGSRVGCAGSTGTSSGCGPARGWFAATRAGWRTSKERWRTSRSASALKKR